MTTAKIGFVGLGIMGVPMVRNLVKSGYSVALFDIDRDLTMALAEELVGSARAAANLKELAEQSDIVFAMLPNGQIVQQVVLGPDGLIHGLRAGSILVDTSSSEPWLTEQTGKALSEQGISMIDAPVSGAQVGAQRAELVFMVGGDEAVVARITPMLNAMGKHIFHLGGLASGHAMKCINNCITAITFGATAEGLISGQRYGLDPAVMVDVLNVSTGGSWITQTHFHQRIFNRMFDDPFKLELMLKDIRISNELARATASPVPYAALTEQFWRMAHHEAGPGASVSEIVRWQENLSGTPLVAGGQKKRNSPVDPA